MSTLHRVRRLLALETGKSVERAVDEELEFHLATRVEELVRSGLPPQAAEAEARRQFGDVAAARAELTRMDRRRRMRRRRLTWWTELRQDVRFALRVLRGQPGFTAVILLTIALGIGANGAIYSVVNAALLRPLPFREPDRLVHLWETKQGLGDRSEASYPDFLDWRAQNATFEQIEGYGGLGVTVLARGEPLRTQGAHATAGFLRMLGATPAVGRTFAPGEDQPGGAPLVVLSHGFWERRFGSDSGVVGQGVVVDGVSRTIIGVLPRGFLFAPVGDADIWIPTDRAADVRAERFNHWLNIVGRLRSGVRIDRARADLGTVMTRLAGRYPETNSGRGIAVVPLREEIVGPIRPTLLVLLGAVVLVLLVACANVASLLLARALDRGREMAVRVALGASQGRLVRQLLTESLLLAFGGGLLGVWVAQNAVRALVGAIPASVRATMPYLQNLGVDRSVVAYLAVVALATGAAFGLAPALYASRPALASLMSGDRRSTGGVARAGMSNGLVVFEIALTVVLLVGAGLLTRSLTRLVKVDPGFDPTRSLVMRIALPRGMYDSAATRQRLFENVLARVRGIPGVTAVGAVSNLPLNGGGTNTFRVDGQPLPDRARRPEAVMRAVAGDYFRAMGIRLIDGRVLDARDDSTAAGVILINESFARQLFGNRRAVGERLWIYVPESAWTIVGVVADVRITRLDENAPPTIYYSHLQGAENRMSVAIRSSVDPGALAASARRAVLSLDPSLPVYGVRTMEREISDSPAVYARRYPLVLLGTFAAAALILAIVGIAGVISYSVSQRMREIGIRVALGADRRRIVSMILRQGGALAVSGVVIGVVAALGGARWLDSVLYGVSAADPLTYICISVLIVGVALGACLVPALRATQVDPATVLRAD
jgi:putative ABC transport system permease protein